MYRKDIVVGGNDTSNIKKKSFLRENSTIDETPKKGKRMKRKEERIRVK